MYIERERYVESRERGSDSSSFVTSYLQKGEGAMTAYPTALVTSEINENKNEKEKILKY